MTRQQVNLTFSTPNWNWCEIRNAGRNTKSGERCKFCQEVKKRGDATRYFCLIYDTDLHVEDGSVAKCRLCKVASLISTDVDIEPVATNKTGKQGDAYKVAKATLKEYKSTYKAMRKEGYPEYFACDATIEQVLKSWGEEAPGQCDDFDFFLEDYDD